MNALEAMRTLGAWLLAGGVGGIFVGITVLTGFGVDFDTAAAWMTPFSVVAALGALLLIVQFFGWVGWLLADWLRGH